MPVHYLLLAFLLSTMLTACGNQPPTGEHKASAESSEAAVTLSPEAASQVEIKDELIASRKLQAILRVTGQIKPEIGKEVNVNARFVGRVDKLLVTLGQPVKKGDTLATVESQEITSMQAELIESKSKLDTARAHEERERQIFEEQLQRPEVLIQARASFEDAQAQMELAEANFKRLESLYREKIASQKDLLQSKAAYIKSKAAFTEASIDLQREERLYRNKSMLKRDYQEAKAETAREKQHVEVLRQRLISMAVAESIVDQIIRTGRLIGIIPIKAPANGVITHVGVAVGEVIDPSKQAFTISDLATVVLSADIPEADVRKVRLGTRLKLKLASDPKHPIEGTISYVGMHVDAHTRTVPIRAHLDNSDGHLKPNMFAEVEIETEPNNALACPKAAIQERDGRKVVYVRQGDEYKERPIITGTETEEYCEIKSGISEGDKVATQGSLMLRTKLTYQH